MVTAIVITFSIIIFGIGINAMLAFMAILHFFEKDAD